MTLEKMFVYIKTEIPILYKILLHPTKNTNINLVCDEMHLIRWIQNKMCDEGGMYV